VETALGLVAIVRPDVAFGLPPGPLPPPLFTVAMIAAAGLLGLALGAFWAHFGDRTARRPIALACLVYHLVISMLPSGTGCELVCHSIASQFTDSTTIQQAMTLIFKAFHYGEVLLFTYALALN